MNFLMLGVAAMLASCSQEDALRDTVNDNEGLRPMTITATLPADGMASRAGGDAAVARCYAQVLAANGEELADGNSVPKRMELADGVYTTTVYLRPGETYDFLFWADTETPTDQNAPASLKAVAYANGQTIAWAGKTEDVTWRASGASGVSATLEHVVTRVTVNTTTEFTVDGTHPLTVNVPTVYGTYNVAAGKAEGGAVAGGYTFNAAAGTYGAGEEAGHFYVLGDGNNQRLVLHYGYNPEKSISDVPMAANTHVTLSGDILHSGLVAGDIAANVTSDWGEVQVQDGLTVNTATHTITLEREGLLTKEAIAQAVGDNGELTVVGPMNQTDFENLGESCQVEDSPIRTLDLSGVETQLTELPKNTAKVGEAVWYKTNGCVFAFSPNLEEIALPKAIRRLQFVAFRGCVSLRVVKAPGVTTLKSSMFYDCSSLTEVWFTSDGVWTEAESEGEMQEYAFANITAASITLYLDSSQQPYVDEEAKTWTPSGNTTPVSLIDSIYNMTVNVEFVGGE